ncbi:MAG TPA: tetratricopeptide repeat protein [Chitinophagaceae bacterium]|nr:tetratricopeptide repeat protein [Chitinophagaceae bacterium]
MGRYSKLMIVLLTAWLVLGCSCKNRKNESAYSEILSKPAFSALTDSIRLSPDNDDLYFRRAIQLNLNNYPEPALVDFKKAWSLKRDERYALGISRLLLDKNPDSSLRFLNQALHELPNSFLLQLIMVRAYDAAGDTTKALATCDRILGQFPDQVDILKMKAGFLSGRGDRAGAILALERAYHFIPNDPELTETLVSAYAESKNIKLLRVCDSLIRKDSLHQNAAPYYYKGVYYSNTGDNTTALSLFDQAIQHDYNYLTAYIEKGRILFEQKKINEALKVFQLANTIRASFPDPYYWIGKCQEAMGQKEEARLNYERAYSLDKTFILAKQAADKLK